jgi:FlaA1/EpsC-like NDP-sugar epimerase
MIMVEKFDASFGAIKSTKVLLHILIDSFIIIVSFMLSLMLTKTKLLFSLDVFFVLGITLSSALGVLILSGFYKIIVSYITGTAAIPAFIAIGASSLTAYICALMLTVDVRLSGITLFGLLSFSGILGIRFIYRHIKMPSKSKTGCKKVLIYGAGSAGRQLVNGLGLSVEFTPVAFIDDNYQLKGRFVGGLIVFDSKNTSKLINELGIDLVVLAMPSIGLERRKVIVSKFANLPVKVRIIPGYEELMSADKDISDLRDVSIYDLLGRNPVPPRTHLLDKTIINKVVAVTGAGGSIGSELCRKIISRSPKTLLLIENSEFALYTLNEELKVKIENLGSNVILVPILGSVQDYHKMKSVIGDFSVETLFHSAAYKHVPLVESNIAEGVKNNVFGTWALARAAVECDVGVFTLISTDKAVRPTNVMGASKRLAEFVCSYMMDQGQNTIFSMVRFGNVLGSSGSVVPLFERQIRNRGPVTITHPDITRFFMTIPEAAELVIQAAALGKGKEVFLLDMGASIKILDLAKEMIRLKGKIPFFPENPGITTPDKHIPILFTGLRPGEKLYEELLVNENSEKTEHPLIMSAVESGPSNVEFEKILKKLGEACDSSNEPKIRKLMIDAGTGLTSGQ